MNLVCNTWKGHDELGKVYNTTPKQYRRQVFAFFLFFFDNHYKSESSRKGKCIFQALSILHRTIMNLSAIKRAGGLQLIQHSSNNSKHTVKLYFDEVSDRSWPSQQWVTKCEVWQRFLEEGKIWASMFAILYGFWTNML